MEGGGPGLAPTLAPALQRARGTLAVSVRVRDGLTVLERFRQEGCLKARLPRPEPGAWTCLVTLNSSGGIAQGDRLNTAVTAAPGAALTVASQAAERYYRAGGGAPATITTRLEAEAGAALEWLPQETILFDGCAVDRQLDIHLDPSAWFLGVETLVFGRAAMGETVQALHLRDTIRLHRAGRLAWHDRVRLDQGQAVLDRPAVAAGARAVATLVHAGPGAADRLNTLRAALAPFQAGATAMDDGLVLARVAAADGACARAAIVAALAALRGARPLPRVWSC